METHPLFPPTQDLSLNTASKSYSRDITVKKIFKFYSGIMQKEI